MVREASSLVLFEQRFWDLIARGDVTVTFRRWKRYELSPRGQAYLDGLP